MKTKSAATQASPKNLFSSSLVRGFAIVALLGGGNASALAACSVSGTTQTLNFPDSISVSRNAAPGDVLAERTLTISGSCTADEQVATGVYNSAANPAWNTSALENTVTDPTSGIGLSLSFTTDNGISWPTAGALNDANIRSATFSSASQTLPFTLNVRAIYLVADRDKIKTSSLAAQTLNFTQRNITGSTGTLQPFFSLNLPAMHLTRQTCDIITNDVLVDMGTININQFRGQGSVTGDKPFNIDLNCDSPSEIALNFTGTTLAGRKDVLALNQGSTASGLGVQFLYNDRVVNFDSTPVPLISSATQGTFSIPLLARYIQTESQVKAGTVYTTSNFDIIYL